MPVSAAVSETAYFVLMDGNRRIGLDVIPLHSGTACSTIYGFSDKEAYDAFCTSSDPGLKPYPLVKGYLRSQVAERGDSLKLVVLDAGGPHEACLHAATMEAVLEAQEKRTNHVTATHRLLFDGESNAYRVEEVVVSS